jgi:hypothetical protein
MDIPEDRGVCDLRVRETRAMTIDVPLRDVGIHADAAVVF